MDSFMLDHFGYNVNAGVASYSNTSTNNANLTTDTSLLSKCYMVSRCSGQDRAVLLELFAFQSSTRRDSFHRKASPIDSHS